MTTFLKYPSLINSSNFAGGLYHKFGPIIEQEYVATEKIHGTNFSITYNVFNQEFVYGKRTGFLLEEENFFNYTEYFDNFNKDFMKEILYHFGHDTIRVYGEFYGDTVQHMKYVANNRKEKDFKIFNIILSDNDTTKHLVLGYENMQSFISEDNIVPYITKGNIWDLLNTLDMDKESELGGPSEGYVLQPYNTRVWDEKDNYFGAVKHKTEAFSEISSTIKRANIIRQVSVLAEMEAYVNQNRLNNILSKDDIQPVRVNFKQIMDLMIADVINEYEGDLTNISVEGLQNQLKGTVGKFLGTVLK